MSTRSTTRITVANAYRTVKNYLGSVVGSRANLKFGGEFTIADASPDTLITRVGYFNVQDYGAKGDGVTDDTAAIQACIDAAAAAMNSAGQSPVVAFTAGKSFLTSKPLRIRTDNQVLMGGGGGAVQARIVSSAGGPLIIVAPASYPSIPTVVGLHGGTAIQLPGTNQHFNLRMDGNALGDLNGLAAFTAEVWVQPNTVAAGIQSIIGSSGRRGQNDVNHIAFLLLQQGQAFTGKLSVGATTWTLNTGSIAVVGTNYHLALTYDGSNIRLFVNGVVQVTQAATGTITQTDFEDLTIGPSIDGWPDCTNLFNGFTGIIDTFRVSNSARYVANFTPSNSLPTDGNALYQGDWSQIYDLSARMHGNGGTCWAPLRVNGFGAAISQTVIRHLLLDGSSASNGLYIFYAHHWILEDLNIIGGLYCYVNLLIYENPFIGSIRNLEIGSARVGMITSVAAGIIGVERANFIGGRYQLAVANGSMELTQPFFQPSNSTVNSVMALNQNCSLIAINPIFDIEFAVGTYQNCFYFSGSGKSQAQLVGADISSTLGIPSVLVDAWGSLNVFGGVVATSGEPYVFQFNSAPLTPTNIVGMAQAFGTTVPWSNNYSYCGITPATHQLPRLFQATQSLAFSATPAFDPTLGNVIHIGPCTANITAPTMVAGLGGERCTITFLKDATANTYTIAGWGSNVRTSGTLTFTSGASSLASISFVWDDRLSTPAWVETARSAFN